MNAVAREVKAWNREECPERDIKIVFFSYGAISMPPVVMDENKVPVVDENGNYTAYSDEYILEDNLVVQVCGFGNDVCDIHSTNSESDYQRIARWRAVCDQFFFWCYSTTFSNYMIPFNCVETRGELYEFMYGQGAELIFDNAQYGTAYSSDFGTFKSYIYSQMMWNVRGDLDQLIENFFNNYYGEAAPAMKKMYSEYRSYMKYLYEVKNLGYYIHGAAQYATAEAWPYQRIQGFLSCIDEAFAAIEPLQSSDPDRYETLHTRILREEITYRYLELYIYPGTFSTDAYSAAINQLLLDCYTAGITEGAEPRFHCRIFILMIGENIILSDKEEYYEKKNQNRGNVFAVLDSFYGIVSAVGCNNGGEEENVSITLSPTQITILEYEEEVVTATLTGAEGSITWESSDESVVIVENGHIYGTGEGSATVTARYGDAHAECAVTVTDSPYVPTLRLNADPLTLKRGAEYTIEPAIYLGSESFALPADTAVTSSAEVVTAVLAVDGSVVITAAGVTSSAAEVKISCTWRGVLLEQTLSVTVVEDAAIELSETALSLHVYDADGSLNEYGVYASRQITASVYYEGVEQSAAQVTYASDNQSVATVSADGTVIAAAAGSANITVTWQAPSGIPVTAVCAVTVTVGEVDIGDTVLYKTEADGAAGNRSFRIHFRSDGRAGIRRNGRSRRCNRERRGEQDRL